MEHGWHGCTAVMQRRRLKELLEFRIIGSAHGLYACTRTRHTQPLRAALVRVGLRTGAR
jgi:hypothetical protein